MDANKAPQPGSNARPEWGPSALLTPEEAGYHLRYSRAKTYREIKDGSIPSVRVLGRLRVRRSDLARLIGESAE